MPDGTFLQCPGCGHAYSHRGIGAAFDQDVTIICEVCKTAFDVHTPSELKTKWAKLWSKSTIVLGVARVTSR